MKSTVSVQRNPFFVGPLQLQAELTQLGEHFLASAQNLAEQSEARRRSGFGVSASNGIRICWLFIGGLYMLITVILLYITTLLLYTK